jgi:hypothetical protein
VCDTSFEKKNDWQKVVGQFCASRNLEGSIKHAWNDLPQEKIINLNTYAWFVEIMCNGILP